METPNHNLNVALSEDLYTVSWDDTESSPAEDKNFLDDIEKFFREDFENDILEEDIF